MIKATLTGIEYCLPNDVIDNEFLISDMKLDWTAKDIFEKTGIISRHIAGAEEYASDLAVQAAEMLLNKSPGSRERVDYILFCSESPDYALPSTACLIQNRLGLSAHCGALDLGQGCAGFVYGLSVAKGLIESGLAKCILLLTAETYSKYIDRFDKSTRQFFGDGAAASFVEAVEHESDFIKGFVFGTDGRGADNLIVRNSGARYDSSKPIRLFMDGPEIFQFTLRVIPKTVNEILMKAKESVDTIDWFVFHQANSFILRHLQRKLKIPEEKFVIDLVETGNTVSASIPIALKRLNNSRCLQKNDKVLILGFGVGYSWSGCVINWEGNNG